MSPHLFHRVPVRVVKALMEAALDQPAPTAELTEALNIVLYCVGHPDRDRRLEDEARAEGQPTGGVPE